MITTIPLPPIGRSIGDDAPPVSRGAPRETGGSAKLGKIQTALLGSFHPASTEVDIDEFSEILACPIAEAVATPRDVTRAVESLDGRQRAVVSSISVEGRSIGETAEMLEITEGAVRIAFHRGLAAIAARLGSR